MRTEDEVPKPSPPTMGRSLGVENPDYPRSPWTGTQGVNLSQAHFLVCRVGLVSVAAHGFVERLRLDDYIKRH